MANNDETMADLERFKTLDYNTFIGNEAMINKYAHYVGAVAFKPDNTSETGAPEKIFGKYATPKPDQDQMNVDDDAAGTSAQAADIPPAKRIRYDPFTKEKVVEKSATKFVRDTNLRTACLSYMIACCYRIQVHFIGASANDVRASEVALSIFNNCHATLKGRAQEAKERNAYKGVKADVEVVGPRGVVKVNTNHVASEMVILACMFDLPYVKKPDPDWYGVIAPMIAFCLGHSARRNELRVGVLNVTIGKENETKMVSSISAFGLDMHHAPLLKGISYSPAVKSSQAMSLGLGTSLITLMMQKEKAYIGKWVRSVANDISYVKGAASLATKIWENRTNNQAREAVRLLCDIGLIATPRNHNRAAPPMCMLYLLLSHEVATIISVKHMFIVPARFNKFLNNKISGFDFSGKGLFAWYKDACQYEWLYPIGGIEGQQILFDCIFGTMFDEKTVIGKMVGENGDWWKTRNALGKVFEKFGTKALEPIKLKPVKYGSKLASACLTDLVPSTSLQLCAMPTFSGQQDHPILKKFLEVMHKNTSGTSDTTMDLAATIGALKVFKRNLLENLSSLKALHYGTTPWYSTDALDVNDYSKLWVPTTEVFIGANKYYYPIPESDRDGYEADKESISAFNKLRGAWAS